jgi:hypothetical protein
MPRQRKPNPDSVNCERSSAASGRSFDWDQIVEDMIRDIYQSRLDEMDRNVELPNKLCRTEQENP